MKIFYTINPHIENLSMNTLIKDFRYFLQKYYRKTIGPRYFKHKDRQFQIGIFPEKTKKEIKEPHLHMILEIKLNEIKEFQAFIKSQFKQKYPSTTDDLQFITHTEPKVWAYCLKEDLNIITNTDLYIKANNM